MCAICGVFNWKSHREIDADTINRMLAALHHRGPEGSQALIFKEVALGFNRLSFLDLEGGMQPLQNEDGTVSMICNGEIFNFQTLRDELEAKGHRFRTKTDVEVILHLYEEEGLDFPKRLNGQFAIALYDARTGQLLLVRDQVGIGQLFYTVSGGQVIFASEIKGILEYPGVERRLNLKAVDQLMNFPSAVAPTTFFDGICSLRGGHILQICPGEDIRDMEYWDLCYSVEEEDKGEEYYVERLRELLKAAISRRLVADVPIGFYISGGLDSSVIACFVGKYLLNSGYSFSAEISGELNEHRYQQIIHDNVKTTHYKTIITEEELWTYLARVIYYTESGVRVCNGVAEYLLSELVNKSPAKAVLTGQGSDEFFYGYIGFAGDMLRGLQKNKMTPEECALNQKLWGDPFFRFEQNHMNSRRTHQKVYSKEIWSQLNRFSALAESPVNVERLKGLSTQKRRSYIFSKLLLADHLLGERGDRLTFSHSVEGRYPFLDMELLDFVQTIPDKYKLKGTNEKYILKKASEGIVPDEILKRKKFPFQTPGMSSMVKRSAGRPEFLSDELIKKYGIFDVDYVHEMLQMYSQPNFKLVNAYKDDYLLIVMTVTMLCEIYRLSI